MFNSMPNAHVNTNPDTGICYTAFHLNNNIDPDVANELWTRARDLSYKEAESNCSEQAAREAAERGLTPGSPDYEDFCERYVGGNMEDFYCDEPLMEGTYEGVTYSISWLGGAPLLMILESPQTQKFELCSPCVPNACNGSNPYAEGYEGYSVPEDWIRKEEF